MCHRIQPVLLSEVEYLLETRRRTGRALLPQRGEEPAPPDAYPGKPLAFIGCDEEGQLTARELTWGFDNVYAGRAKLVFNTRIETGLAHVRRGEGLWAQPMAHGRCLIPVRGFFESWTRNPPRRGAQVRFVLPGRGGFLLAGVCSDDRVSVVTTVPNASVAPMHSRMPLVLGPGESSLWLGSDYERLADRSGIALEATPE